MYKVIYIDYNFIDKRYPNSPNDGDRFFTYGFGSLFARQFKKYNPELEIECWKTDSRIKDLHIKVIESIKHTVFPSIKFGRFGHYSRKLLSALEEEI